MLVKYGDELRAGAAIIGFIVIVTMMVYGQVTSTEIDSSFRDFFDPFIAIYLLTDGLSATKTIRSNAIPKQ